MLKGKLKLRDKARRVFPDRLGSLVAGFDEYEEERGGIVSTSEAGEELEFIHHIGDDQLRKKLSDLYEFESEFGDDNDDGAGNGKISNKEDDKKSGPVPKIEDIAADEKRSDLEYELSQKEINLEKLQKIATTGLPDGGGLRATVWKLLLGFLPPSRDLWEKEMAESRQKYFTLKQELLSSPTALAKVKGDALDSDKLNVEEGDVAGPLKRHGISQEDHPLSDGKSSPWHQYFEHTEVADQIDRDLERTHPDLKFFSGESSYSKKNREAMRNILLLFAKLNPAIRYVQGMNEVLAPIFYIFSTDTDEQNAANAEADSFSCFVRLLSDSVDHFCQQLDNSPVGILATLSRLSDFLKSNNEELWKHLEIKNKVKPQFYAFRWITLLLTQEFDFKSILRIWDSLLSNPFGVQDMLLRICCAMLLSVKSRLLSGDFAANLRLLQHYPEINIEHLLRVARDLSPDT